MHLWMLRLTCKHCPFVHIGARLILLCIAFIQSGHAWSVRQEGPCFEQGYRSFDRRHFLELWIQNGVSRRSGNYCNYCALLRFTAIIGLIVIILLYCYYCDYCDYCILLTGSRWSGSSWPCLGRETCCNCETSWRSGRPVPSCHAKGVAFLHSEDLCCRRWWLWCCDGTGWIGRAWRCVIAVMPCTGLHNKYLSKLQFRVSQ